jgi:hypothetical protein
MSYLGVLHIFQGRGGAQKWNQIPGKLTQANPKIIQKFSTQNLIAT